MKYTNSIYTPNLTGKQGGTVFSSNQYGPYTCDRRIPVDPKTTQQQNVRAGTAAIARHWAKLTPVQRQNWCSMADNYIFEKKGKRYVLPGFYFFMKMNRNLYEVNEPILENFHPDRFSQPQIFTSFKVRLIDTPTDKDLQLIIYPPINSTTKIKLSATMPLKVTELYGTHKTRKIAVLDSSFVSGSSIKDYYLNKYPTLPESNSKAFFDIKSTNINSGISTTPISSEVYGI